MASSRNTRPSVDGTPIVISAPTLKEAHRRVKAEFGDGAIILNTRNVIHREEMGLGQKKVVEVLVQDPSTPAPAGGLGHRHRRPRTDDTPATGTISVTEEDLLREVERIETLVTEVTNQAATRQRSAAILENPLAETLHHGGVSVGTLEKIFARMSGETGKSGRNRAQAISWLTDNLRASNCDWDGFYGCHAFLGKSGAGRTEMVLQAAARLRTLNRRTLVLSLFPANSGEVRYLQSEAGRHGFDAAVIRKEGQLAASESHLADYDVVLVDMPTLDHPVLAVGGELHSWLADNPGFHRHLLVAGDQDPTDVEDLVQAAKAWNCDWVAVSRLDQTRKPGKLLDFTDSVPLPLSLAGFGPKADEPVEIAASGRLIDMILNQGSGLADSSLLSEGRA